MTGRMREVAFHNYKTIIQSYLRHYDTKHGYRLLSDQGICPRGWCSTP